MKKLMLIVAQLIMAVGLSAQEVVEYGPDVFIDIDGVQIGDKLTKEDMVSHFGELISEKYEEGDIYNCYEYEFKDVEIQLDESRALLGFKLVSSNYPVMTLYKKGESIRVGDSLEKFLSLGYPICFSREVAKTDEESYFIFCVKIKDYVPDYRTYLTIKNGIIICIESWPDFS